MEKNQSGGFHTFLSFVNRRPFSFLLHVCLAVVMVVGYNNCGSGFTLPVENMATYTADSGSQTPNQPIQEDPSALVPLNLSLEKKCSPATLRGASAQSVHKLTKLELLNTLKDLFASDSNMNSLKAFADYTYVALDKQRDLQIGFNKYPAEFSRKPGEDFESSYGREQFMSWILIADAASIEFYKYKYFQSYTTNSCLTTTPATKECFTEFITKFGRRALRRPVASIEIEQYHQMIAGLSVQDSVQKIVSRMLRSPEFLFHIESGVEDAEGRVRLNDHEVANRLSYYIIGSLPDSTLQQAADQGQLKTLAQVEEQASRLFALPRAKAKMRGFFSDWLRLEDVKSPINLWGNYAMVPTGYADLYDVKGIKKHYQEEVYNFLEYVIWDHNGSFKDLMTMKVGFPKERKLAHIYGTGITTGAPVETPGHPGLLTRAGLLSSSGLNPNLIMRAVIMKRQVLCDTMPSPDFSIVADRISQEGELDPMLIPNHEIVTRTTSSTSCVGCHAQINPLGNLFENYNPLGQRKSKQEAILGSYDFYKYKKTAPELPTGVFGALFDEFDLPGPQANLYIENGLPTTFQSSDDFIEAVAISQKARACMNVRLFRHMTRRPERTEDACAVKDSLDPLVQDQPILRSFIKSVANEDIFWRKD